MDEFLPSMFDTLLLWFIILEYAKLAESKRGKADICLLPADVQVLAEFSPGSVLTWFSAFPVPSRLA